MLILRWRTWKRTARWVLPVALLAVGILTTNYLKSTKPEARARPSAPTLLQVRTEPVVAITHQTEITLFGRIRPERTTDIAAAITGHMTALHDNFTAGGYVAKGAVLAEIDNASYRLAVARAENAVIQAESALEDERIRQELAISDWQRLSPENIPENNQDVPARIARAHQIRAARARVADAKLTLEDAKQNLARTQITAPYDAVILATHAGLGAWAAPGKTIATLYEAHALEIPLYLSRANLATLGAPSQNNPVQGEATVTLDSEYIFPITMTRMVPSVATSQRETQGIARLDRTAFKHGEPIPLVGQWASVRLFGKRFDNVVVIPRELWRSVPAEYAAEYANNGDAAAFAVATVVKGRILWVIATPRLITGNTVILDAAVFEDGARLVVSNIPFGTDGIEVHTETPT